jgi:hypothetical protein
MGHFAGPRHKHLTNIDHPPPTNDTIVFGVIIEGEPSPFDITAPAGATIQDLKKLIKAEVGNDILNGINISSLRLWKVSGFSQL